MSPFDHATVHPRNPDAAIYYRPAAMMDACAPLAEASAIPRSAVVVSIAAGITLATLHSLLGAEQRIVRLMPNTPALVGAMSGGYVLGDKCTDADDSLMQRLFGALGLWHSS